MTLYEIWTEAALPYGKAKSNQRVWVDVCQGYRLERPSGCDKTIYALMRRCWEAHPGDRPCFAELVHRLRKLYTATTGEQTPLAASQSLSNNFSELSLGGKSRRSSTPSISPRFSAWSSGSGALVQPNAYHTEPTSPVGEAAAAVPLPNAPYYEYMDAEEAAGDTAKSHKKARSSAMVLNLMDVDGADRGDTHGERGPHSRNANDLHEEDSTAL